MMASRIILVSGKPGIGKTTLLSKVYNELSKLGICVSGFRTEEVCTAGFGRPSRIGFDIVLFADEQNRQRAILSRSDRNGTFEPRNGPRVGQYVVDLSSFESLAVPYLEETINQLESLKRTGSGKNSKLCVYLIDEIGKMELSSSKFTNLMEKLVHLVLESTQKNIDSFQNDFKIVLLATIPSPRRPNGTRGLPLVDMLCAMKNISLVEIDRKNRDSTVHEIVKLISNKL